jgi:hypothetical protein
MLTQLSAKENQQNIVLISTLDSIIFPIVIPEKIPDITKPVKPQSISTIPSSTSNDSVDIEIRGESGTKILVNGRIVGTIGSSGKAIIALDTSGPDGTKSFTITLRDNSNNISDALVITIEKIPDPKFDISYKGLTFYHEDLPSSSYQLNQLTDDEFNALSNIQKLYVANKLLGTFFFGYPQKELQEKINSGHFIENIQLGLSEDITDKAWLENYIIDDSIFRQSSYNEQEAVDILSRFFAMKKLDSYFMNNWVAYTLTQTILFSPAYELDTAHAPNIANVYNRIVLFLNEDSGMRYISYVHMMSEDNWRRFRSPEDNGREMIELFALDEDDTHVLIAGQALQNWKLDSDSDTLVVGLNQNTEPLNLFNTIIYNGDDFYRELVKSSLFTTAVTTRLVDHFFPNETSSKKAQITSSIVASNPETWRDIMLQIVFSEEYLLHSIRPKSAEELFFSLAKKMEYKHRTSTLHEFKDALEDMHQASMKYKLGKSEQVPLDTLSFATYHKFIRERVMLRKSNPDKIDNYSAYDRMGWDEHFIDNTQFDFQENNVTTSLESLVQYLFHTTISRDATSEEVSLFHTHMTYVYNGSLRLRDTFNMVRTNSDPTRQKSLRESRKRNITFLVLDYISRLSETYSHMEVK